MSQRNSYLEHFGIFGMKWGVRRYQNEDGSYTEEGKKRYSARKDQLEGSKYHVNKNIRYQEENAKILKLNADRLRKQSLNENIVELWGDKKSALAIEGSMDRIKDVIRDEIAYRDHKVDVANDIVKEQKKLFEKLSHVKINVIDSDSKYTRMIEDIVANETKGFLRYMNLLALKSDTEEYKNNKQSSGSEGLKRKTLTQRFDDARKDNPKLTYNQIYKEMKVDMNSEDPDDYKEAEDKWLRKHGY